MIDRGPSSDHSPMLARRARRLARRARRLARRARWLEWSAVPLALVLAALLVGRPQDAAVGLGLAMIGLSALTVWIVWQDVATLTIADSAVLALAFVALGLRFAAGATAGDTPLETLLASVVDAALPGGLLWLFREIHFRRKGYDGLGLGDVKLAAAGGLLLGAVGLSWAVCGGSLLALVCVAVRRRGALHASGQEKIAFGATLAPAIWLVCVVEHLPALLPLTGR